jgi:hypothetical protein
MSGNPFTFGNPIHTTARFYGRQAEIRQVLNRLLSNVHESTSIVGERRIGKTSLLKYLANPDVAPQLGLTPDRFCLIYIDFQGLTDITPDRFWRRVLAMMARNICDPSLALEIETLCRRECFDLFDLEDLCGSIAARGLTIVLLLDEFEYVTQNPNFRSDFFGGLRALAIHRDLPLVTSTRRELVDLCHSDEIKGSPFFNIFANVILRPFDRDEVFALIDGYTSAARPQFTEADVAFVASLSGRHPLFVQMAGYYLFEAKQMGLNRAAMIESVVSNFDAQADPHFHYLWTHCSESERITLLATILLGRQKPSEENLPTQANLARYHSRAHLDVPTLLERSILLEDPELGTYRLFSPSLERWISREISAIPGEEETPASVEAWMNTGGKEKERIQPLKGLLPKFKKQYWPLVSTILHELTFEIAGAAAFEFLVKALL